MIYKEEVRDLFTVSEDYYLAHCISSDFAMGRGIAVEFVKRFDMKKKLQARFPDFIYEMRYGARMGECILVDRVLNLVTKERYFQKPTYCSISQALAAMRDICIANNIKKVAMPLIGCGLDRLDFNIVKILITETFQDLNIEILVCLKQ